MNLLTIEARINSSRLPGKVLLELDNVALIKIIVEKCKKLSFIDNLVVATTSSSKDDILCDFLTLNNIDFFRGSENDVCKRLVDCSKKYQAQNLIKLTGDNPFIDINLIKEGFDIFNKLKNIDILCVCDKRSVPIGFDFEILKTNTLIKSYSNKMSDYDKEHATTYLKKHFKKFDFFPERFISKDFIKDVELTIDNYEDFKFAEKIITLSKSNIFKLGIDEIQKIYLDSHLKHNSIRKWSKGI